MSALLLTANAQAECAKDTDCQGALICEASACVAAPATASAADGSSAAAGAAAPAAAPDGPAKAAPPAAAPSVSAWDTAATRNAEYDAPPTRKRHSVAMMATGIVMVSLAPVALIAAAAAVPSPNYCPAEESYDCPRASADASIALVITHFALVGFGIPLIVTGAKKEPVEARASASDVPFATPDSAGVRFKLTL